MNGIELFAYVILPVSIAGGAWCAYWVIEWRGRRRHRAGE
jgi:hypothetical protein